MLVEQIYTKCLSEAAYYIESNGEAAIIDPIREIDYYIEKAKSRNVKIKYVFETHFHADFVSGHIDLSKETGAQIVFGPEANPSYLVHNGIDGEIFNLGNITLTLLHTPGHTMESSCYLLKDKDDVPYCIFTGDTLFIGDVGRPDLAVKSDDISKEDLASLMYDSLRNKILTLPDNVIVYPAHGKGSSCGKNLSSETFSTIGEQKSSNYALKNISRQDFIRQVTDGLLSPPNYFSKDVYMNKNGYESLSIVMNKNFKSLSSNKFKDYLDNNAVILDTRSPNEFASGFIKNSINIGLDGQFAPWVGAIIPVESKILFISNKSREKEVITRLARVGYENVLGFLRDDVKYWSEKLDFIENVTADYAITLINSKKYLVLDVRRPDERSLGHVFNSSHIHLPDLYRRISELNKNDSILVYCAGGYRSMIAASILKKSGYNNVTNIIGGYNKLKDYL